MLGRSVATVPNRTLEEEEEERKLIEDLIMLAQLAVARRRCGLAPEI